MPFSATENSISRRPEHYNKEPTTVGGHLLKARIDRRLTKAAAAKLIGVSPDSITRWEEEKGMPEVTQMKNIIAFLGYYPLPEPVTLTEQLRKYRQVHGLTLEEFGKLLRVDGATVWTWENGKYIPSPETAQKIEKILIPIKEPF